MLSQYSHTGLPVSTLFLSFTSGCAVAFWHCSWQDLTRNEKLVLAEDAVVEFNRSDSGTQACAAELVILFSFSHGPLLGGDFMSGCPKQDRWTVLKVSSSIQVSLGNNSGWRV